MKRPLLSIPQVCERLNVKDGTVRQLIASGKLRALMVGHQWRIDEDDLEQYIALQKAAAHGPTVDAAVSAAFDADRHIDQTGNPFV